MTDHNILPCNVAVMHRLGDTSAAHGPHEWTVQAGMESVRCPGTGMPATVPVPPAVLRDLIHVAAWVSRGRSAAFTPDDTLGSAYPDAKARRALGAVDDLGLRRLVDKED